MKYLTYTYICVFPLYTSHPRVTKFNSGCWFLSETGLHPASPCWERVTQHCRTGHSQMPSPLSTIVKLIEVKRKTWSIDTCYMSATQLCEGFCTPEGVV